MTSGFSSERELAKIKPHSGLSSQLAHNEPTRSPRDLHESSISQAIGQNSEISPRHYAPELVHNPINTAFGYTTPTTHTIPVVNDRNALLQSGSTLTGRCRCREQEVFSTQHNPECCEHTSVPKHLAPLFQDIEDLFGTYTTANNFRSVPSSPKSQPSSEADGSSDWTVIDKCEAVPGNTHASIAASVGEYYSPMEAYQSSSFKDEPWFLRVAPGYAYGASYNPNSTPSEHEE